MINAQIQKQQFWLELKAKHAQSLSKIEHIFLNSTLSHQKKIEDGELIINEIDHVDRGGAFSKGNQPHQKVQLLSLFQLYSSNKNISSKQNNSSKLLQYENQFQDKITISDHERIKFVRHMQNQRDQLLKLKSQHHHNIQLKNQEEEFRQKQMFLQKETELKERKRKDLQKRIEEIHDKNQRRMISINLQNKEYQQKLYQPTLEQKMQQKFTKFEQSSLEEKKKKLATIRELHKPLSKTQFQDHLSRIVQYKHGKQIAKSQGKQNQSSPKKNQFYKSRWYKSVVEEEKQLSIDSQQEQKQILMQNIQKSKQYSEYIRENFVPEVDEKKVAQILSKKIEPIKRKKAKQIRQIGLDNLQYSKQQKITKQQELNKIKETKTSQQISKPKDYLEELKQNRKNRSLNESFMQKLSKETKVQKLSKETDIQGSTKEFMKYAEKLERQAKQQEQIDRVKKKTGNIEVDEMYMNALKVKMEILNKI